MLVLITQIFWAINAYTDNKKEIKSKVKNALSVAAKKATDHSACFEVFAKAYIKPGEGFHLGKLNRDKQIDTLPMLFNGHGAFYNESKEKFLEKFNRLDFSNPVTAEIVVNFRYQFADSNFSKISQDSIFNKLNPINFQEVFSGNAGVTSLYNIKYIDSTLKAELKKTNIEMPYWFGIIESASNSVVFKSKNISDSLFLQSDYLNSLNEQEYFNKHYKLALVFDSNFIVGRNLWVMLSISAFAVLLLTVLVLQYISVITRQRKINEMKNDFINNMTHEFNTPIANISLAAESLTKNEEFQKDEKTSKLIDIIHEQNETIRRNVEHILKIAANDKRVMHLNKEKLNVSDVIRSVICEFSLSINEKGGEIIFIEPSSKLILDADEFYLLHVVQNILDNAIKYNTNKPKITISVHSDESFIFISIEDNGIGMSKEEMKHIFDKFYRANTGNIHHSKGFGLGLNYVQSIVKAHNGHVYVKSKLGKGSKFDILIPKID